MVKHAVITKALRKVRNGTWCNGVMCAWPYLSNTELPDKPSWEILHDDSYITVMMVMLSLSMKMICYIALARSLTHQPHPLWIHLYQVAPSGNNNASSASIQNYIFIREAYASCGDNIRRWWWMHFGNGQHTPAWKTRGAVSQQRWGLTTSSLNWTPLQGTQPGSYSKRFFWRLPGCPWPSWSFSRAVSWSHHPHANRGWWC